MPNRSRALSQSTVFAGFIIPAIYNRLPDIGHPAFYVERSSKVGSWPMRRKPNVYCN